MNETRQTEEDFIVDMISRPRYEQVVDEICDLAWSSLGQQEMTHAAWAYYYFSIQFRESLDVALGRNPGDRNLIRLASEECDTDNLSPWPGVAAAGERMNHDEFMRRLLCLADIDSETRSRFEAEGAAYLAETRALDNAARALSISSYEDGGLERVFQAILKGQCWDGPLLAAFKHFLEAHIMFDSDPEQGHGALSRHLVPTDQVLPLWEAFKHLLTTFVPQLESGFGPASGKDDRILAPAFNK